MTSERYAKKISLYAQTPSGETVTRKTDRPYKFVSMIFVKDGTSSFYKPGWNVISWHESEKAALNKTNHMVNYFPQTAIVPVIETKPEPTHFETVREAFLTAPAVKVVKPSLSFPEPVPGKSFKTFKEGHTFRFILFVDGKARNSFYHMKEHVARQSVKRFLGLGYALTDDGAKLVSPVSKYKG